MGRAHEVRAASMAKTAAIKSKQNAKFSKAIYIAAKSGLPDPDMNATLKKEIEKAKKAHIPADVIKKAIEACRGQYYCDSKCSSCRRYGSSCCK